MTISDYKETIIPLKGYDIIMDKVVHETLYSDLT